MVSIRSISRWGVGEFAKLKSEGRESFTIPLSVILRQCINSSPVFSALLAIIEQGGLAPGGLNFDCKIRRESTDLEDMFIAHIGKLVMFAFERLRGATGATEVSKHD